MKLLKWVHAEDNKPFATILISIINYGGGGPCFKVFFLKVKNKNINILG